MERYETLFAQLKTARKARLFPSSPSAIRTGAVAENYRYAD
jgi:hypothetical protein